MPYQGTNKLKSFSKRSIAICRANLTRALFGLILVALLAMALTLILVALSRRAGAHHENRGILQIGVAMWALLNVWVTLDGARIYTLTGKAVDPLGPETLGVSGLGLVNIFAALLFIVLKT
jgi:hypothetical protein